MDWQNIANAATAIGTLLAFAGLIMVFFQLKSTQKAIEAQTIIKLIDDWQNPEIYTAIKYIHKLRGQWKEYPPQEWDELAMRWVKDHANKTPDTSDPAGQELWNEWMWRRTASQFLSKMGLLVSTKMLSSNTLFGVVPEMGRLLAVLIPIEMQISKYWREREKKSIAQWDRPFEKWEFNELWSKYLDWNMHRGNKYELTAINWATELPHKTE